MASRTRRSRFVTDALPVFTSTNTTWRTSTASPSHLGVKIKDIYWTIGPHDLVGIVETADDETLAAAMLRLGAVGNVRTTTMRAFGRKEAEAVIAKSG